jgi:hypothetical protein
MVSKDRQGRVVIAFCGHHDCGKDVACRTLARLTSLRFGGSLSEAILPHAARRLSQTHEEAWATRHVNHEVWNQEAYRLRSEDPAALVRARIENSDLISGIRSKRELEVSLAEQLVTLAVWVDRDVPSDPTLEYGPELCHIRIENFGSEEAYIEKLSRFARLIQQLRD